VSVGYCFEENIHEDFKFCRPLTDRIAGSDTFKDVNDLSLQKILHGQTESKSVRMIQLSDSTEGRISS
jgi:hypothetical protein